MKLLIKIILLLFGGAAIGYAVDPETARQIVEIYERSVDLREEGELDDAERVARDGLKKFPESEDLMVVLADILNHQGRATEAVQYYKKALLKQPQAANILSALCSAQVNTGEFKEAARHCEKAHALNPRDGTAWFNLGKSYASLGEYTKARANFAKYVKEFERDSPNDPFVLQAKSEEARLAAIIENRRSNAAPLSDTNPGFSAEDEQIIKEIIRRYTKLGMSPAEAESTVNGMRPAWMTLRGAQRKANLMQMRDGLPE